MQWRCSFQWGHNQEVIGGNSSSCAPGAAYERAFTQPHAKWQVLQHPNEHIRRQHCQGGRILLQHKQQAIAAAAVAVSALKQRQQPA
jgi:hypothetical protein